MHRWKVSLASGTCTVEATTEALLELAQFDGVLGIRRDLGSDGLIAPRPVCRVCGGELFFTKGWAHHPRPGADDFEWHTDPYGNRFCDTVDHRAEPTFKERR